MKRQWESQTLFLVWVVTALVVACFHEPWRDEAQAWLVVRSSESFWELLVRASIEATGPIYYWMLWAPAQAFPSFFPHLIFLISFVGTALFVWDFSRSSFVPLWWRWAICLGFMIGYEYAVVARVYGWGCFFLWRGITADRQGSTRAPYWFALACLTQLSFFVALLGWLAHRFLSSHRRENWLYYWPLAAAIVLMLAHGTLGAHYRNWSWVEWNDAGALFKALGTTLATPFIHGPKLAVPGLIVLLAALLPLSNRARIGLLVSVAAFTFIFVVRYRGMPHARHGGAIFLVWVALLVAQPSLSRFAKAIIGIIVVVNILTGLGMRAQDVLYPFSHASAAAKVIEQRLAESHRPLRLYADKIENGLTLAALLNIDLWSRGQMFGCPFFAGSCAEPPRPSAADTKEGIDECARNQLCLHATEMFELPPENPTGFWQPLFKPTQPALRESISVYEFVLHPASGKR
jgi:hypothetical protein